MTWSDPPKHKIHWSVNSIAPISLHLFNKHSLEYLAEYKQHEYLDQMFEQSRPNETLSSIILMA